MLPLLVDLAVWIVNPWSEGRDLDGGAVAPVLAWVEVVVDSYRHSVALAIEDAVGAGQTLDREAALLEVEAFRTLAGRLAGKLRLGLAIGNAGLLVGVLLDLLAEVAVWRDEDDRSELADVRILARLKSEDERLAHAREVLRRAHLVESAPFAIALHMVHVDGDVAVLGDLLLRSELDIEILPRPGDVGNLKGAPADVDLLGAKRRREKRRDGKTNKFGNGTQFFHDD